MFSAREANSLRFHSAQKKGHIESFFIKANHPQQAQAFWIRFTIYIPNNNLQKEKAELWFMMFDSLLNTYTAIKKTYPLKDIVYKREAAELKIQDACLGPGYTKGTISQDHTSLKWDIEFTTKSKVLTLLPYKALYKFPLPRTKLITPYPDEVFSGEIIQNKRRIEISHWKGMQGHNWGSTHAEEYVWAHCNLFEDNLKDTFFEGVSAKIRIGRFVTPYLTSLHLRLKGKDIPFSSISSLWKNSTQRRFFLWSFTASNKTHTLKGIIKAKKEHIIGLEYLDPKGRSLFCLNSKIASCSLFLIPLSKPENITELKTTHGCALEIGTRDKNHGIKISL
jgi:hypothetical protein